MAEQNQEVMQEQYPSEQVLDGKEFKINWRDIRDYLSSWDNILQIIKTAFPYIVIYAIILYVFNNFDISAESIRASLEGKGPILLPAFLLIQMTASLTPLPDLPFIATGVLFFQPWLSFVVIWTGMWAASIINFYIARKLGRGYIEKHYPQTIKWVDRFAGKYGFETLVTARSFTFVPFDLIAYAAGISNMTVVKFGFASIFGLFPVALSSVLVGLAFVSGSVTNTIGLFILSASISLVFGFIARQVRLRQEKNEGID